MIITVNALKKQYVYISHDKMHLVFMSTIVYRVALLIFPRIWTQDQSQSIKSAYKVRIVPALYESKPLFSGNYGNLNEAQLSQATDQRN